MLRREQELQHESGVWPSGIPAMYGQSAKVSANYVSISGRAFESITFSADRS